LRVSLATVQDLRFRM